MSRQAAFVETVLEQMGIPYIWGGKSPTAGFDCSGLVTFAWLMAGGPDWRPTHNTDRLWNELEPCRFPSCGDLAFFGGARPDDVNHVMVVVPLDGNNPDLLVGACGGDHTTVNLREAHRRRARVQVRRGVDYRPDFRGYRKMPF